MMLVPSNISAAATTPMPTSLQYFKYPAIVQPDVDIDPAIARPMGVGTIASGSDTLSLKVILDAFSGPVDIYIAIYAPKLDDKNLYLITADNAIKALPLTNLSQGLEPWKSGVTAAVDETLFGDISVSGWPTGKYMLYVLITPQNELDKGYLYETYFGVSGGSFVIPSTTKHLNSTDTAQLLSAISSDGITFTFTGSNTTLTSLSVGDVLVLGISTLTPYGALRKITAILATNNQVIVETTDASLAEAMQDADVEMFKTLYQGDFNSSSANTRAQIDAKKADANIKFSPISVDIDLLFSNNLRIKGPLKITPSFHYSLKNTYFTVTNLALDYAVGISSQLAITVGFVGPIEPQEEKLMSFVGFPIPIPGPLPLYLTPVHSLVVGMKGELNLGLKTTYNYSASIDAGLTYDNGSWNTTNNFTSSSFFSPLENITTLCNMSSKAYVGYKLELLINGTVKVAYLNLNPVVVKFDLDAIKDPWWELSAGQEAVIGAQLQFFDKKLTGKAEYKVLDTTEVILHAPVIPKALAANGSSTQIDLTWTYSSLTTAESQNGEINYFNIYRDGVLLSTTTSSSKYSDSSNLVSDKEYCYTLVAVDKWNNYSGESKNACAKINTITVTPSASAGGSISPSTPQTVTKGSTTTFTVTADPGYTASVGGTCGGNLSGSTYTTNAITASCTVDAMFKQDSGTLTGTWTWGQPKIASWYEATGTYDAQYNPSSLNICGSRRLPTVAELQTILPVLDKTYPPTYWYWSSETNGHAYGYVYDFDGVWSVANGSSPTIYGLIEGFELNYTKKSGGLFILCM